MSNTLQYRVSIEGILGVVSSRNCRGNLTDGTSDPYGNFSLGSGINIPDLGRKD